MLRKALVVSLLILCAALLTPAQDCKLKFSVVYSDGQSMQVGLTQDQKKMWDRDATKKYKGLCLDDKAPDIIILWNQGLNGEELVKASMNRFNTLYAEGTYGATAATYGSVASAHIAVRADSEVRGKANYYLLDNSQKPAAMIHQGEGFQDVPIGNSTRKRGAITPEDAASTIADPTEALSNALKWLKKDKKI
jgi:hypothetical protein